MPSASQELPTKEQNLFRKIGRCYENKQYKKALSYSKEILQSFPEHGETLAMRGLVLASVGKTSEARDFILLGLKKNIKSFVCWQVFGYFQRLECNYVDAIKAYRNALKWDSENLSILRDLSVLEIQTRDFDGLKETRYKILMSKPSQRISWVGYAISCHLVKEIDIAVNILREFDKIEQSGNVDRETSQILLYENYILCENNRLEEAAVHIENNQNRIVDSTALFEIKANIEYLRENYQLSFEHYMKLLDLNPENHQYFERLIECSDKLNRDRILFLYDIRAKFPKSLMLAKLLLKYLDGDDFQSLLLSILSKYLLKGSPSVFKTFFVPAAPKAEIFQSVLLKVEKDFQSANQQTALVWTWFALAEMNLHFCEISKAIKYVDYILTHTPTLVEAYVIRAKILKRCGSIAEACLWIVEGQLMDTADKYINSKCTKYLLRNNELDRAEKMIAKFLKDVMTPSEYLSETQCLWYSLETARANFRLRNYGESLRKCYDIIKHYNKYIENEYDFHTYCLRRVTICSYVDTLKFDDHIYENRLYIDAALLASKIYIRLYDRKIRACSATDSKSINDSSTLSSELKKQLSKQKKKEAQLFNQQQRQQEQSKHKKIADHSKKASDTNRALPAVTISSDKFASELENTDNPLDEAFKLLTPLVNCRFANSKLQLMAFEIFVRQERLLPSLRALFTMKRCCKVSLSDLDCQLIRFQLAFQRIKSSIDDIEKEVIQHLISEFQVDLDSKIDLTQSVINILQSRNSIDHKIYALRLANQLESPQSLENIIDMFVEQLEQMTLNFNDRENCEELYRDIVDDKLVPENRLSTIKRIFHSKFEHSDVFKSDSQMDELKKSLNSFEENDVLVTAVIRNNDDVDCGHDCSNDAIDYINDFVNCNNIIDCNKVIVVPTTTLLIETTALLIAKTTL
ncbi:hypothetical protein GJ496_006199 [Pomphorhynchus laevis]|nr:hypothetical protein GJ496_006199 [Pomphorhynchus laevis]